VLHAASGGSSTRISLSTETNDFNGLAYIGGPKPSGPVFVPDYRTVLTRFGSVENDRVVIKRVGSIAIQRRVKPFDVTSISGTIVNRVGQNPPMVFVANPMGFIVVGPKGPPPALQVEIHGIRRDQFGKLDPGTRLTRVRRGYRVCIPMRGKGVIRRPTIRVNPPLVSFAAPRWWANKPVVAGGPVLISMHVVPSCP